MRMTSETNFWPHPHPHPPHTIYNHLKKTLKILKKFDRISLSKNTMSLSVDTRTHTNYEQLEIKIKKPSCITENKTT